MVCAFDDESAYHVEYPKEKGWFSLDKKSGDIWASYGDRNNSRFISADLIPVILMLAAETTGNPCLHASGVRIGGGTVLFVANKGEGKSSLCCALTEHGYLLVADDIAPIARKTGNSQVLCAESRIKLWPDSARVLFSSDTFPIPYTGPGNIRSTSPIIIPTGPEWPCRPCMESCSYKGTNPPAGKTTPP